MVAPVTFDAAPADGAKQVNPAAPVSLKVANGTIERVTLTSTGGEAVEYAGEWDLPLRPVLYKAFDVYMKRRSSGGGAR